MFDPIVTLPPDLSHGLEFALAPTLWHLPVSTWKPIWDRIDVSNIRVAVLDTGYTKHDLGPVPVASKSFISGESVVDGNGHGTHCAGTILGADGIGVAPSASLLVGKVLSNSGSGSSSGIAAGIRWAVDQGAHIISMSLGGGSSYTPTNEAIDYAFSKGCWVTAAAGNAGYNGANTVGWPAKYSGCLCTGAYAPSGAIANFSSGGRELDWACPGQEIISFSTNGSGFRAMSGTSMATPYGAGILAIIYSELLRGGYPILPTAAAMRDWFKLNMKDSGAPGFDVRFGFGIPVAEDLLNTLLGDFLYI
jgi:subtilisin